jgi:hypothetical protein
MCQFHLRVLIFGTSPIRSGAAYREIRLALPIFDDFKRPEEGPSLS